MSVRESLAAAARAIAAAPKQAAVWVASNGANVAAVSWLSGMLAFGGVTVKRGLAVRHAREVAEAAQPKPVVAVVALAQTEVLAMPDVDDLEALQKARFHANGLAAAGESEEPDAEAIAAGQAKVAEGIPLVGEQVGASGNIVLVTKGGIGGWVARNKGKKADPETLAWLRNEEQESGMGTYAGWADREDGSILEYAKAQQHAAGSAAPAPGSAPPPPPPPSTVEPTSTSTSPSERLAVAELADLGAAAVAGVVEAQRAPVEPTATQLDTYREATASLGTPGTVAVVVRDHALTLLLIANRLYEAGAPPTLAPMGETVLRKLGALLVAQHPQRIQLTTSADRTMELASELVIAGVDPSRLDIVLAPVDPAVDLVTIAVVP